MYFYGKARLVEPLFDYFVSLKLRTSRFCTIILLYNSLPEFQDNLYHFSFWRALSSNRYVLFLISNCKLFFLITGRQIFVNLAHQTVNYKMNDCFDDLKVLWISLSQFVRELWAHFEVPWNTGYLTLKCPKVNDSEG